MSQDDDGHWHIDRKVNLGIIFAIFVQSITFVGIYSWRESEKESRITSLEKSRDNLEQSDQTSTNRLTIVEQRFIAIQDSLAEIKQDVKSIKAKP